VSRGLLRFVPAPHVIQHEESEGVGPLTLECGIVSKRQIAARERCSIKDSGADPVAPHRV
jgi:hypothetical protein